MAQDIKQKISLTGEKEYNAALKDAQRHLKTLRSELKAETAELGANATAQDKNRVKSQNLQKQIREQEKVVKTLREALEQAKKEYGDNEEVVAKWEQKLNDARTTLANMQNDMQRMGNDIRQVNAATAEGVVATKSFADAIDKIGTAGGGIADALEGTFMSVVDVIKDAIGELWGLIAETAKKANEWTDIAAIWNTTPGNIQAYARGVEYAGKSFSDLNNAVNKIVMGDRKKILMLTGQGLAGDGDEWQYAMDVLGAIAKIESHSKQLEVIGEIFGDKRAAGIMDLINEWDRIQEGADKLTEGGYGLGDHELEVMDNIAKRISEIEASWTALKDHLAGKLAEATLPIMIDVQGALDGLAEYMNATTPAEQAQALEKITANITQFCTDVANALTAGLEIIGAVGEGLSESDNVIAKAVGNALLKLKKTLEWLMDEKNWSTIKDALETFFGLWVAGKGAAALAKIATLAANIKTISAFKALSSISSLLTGGAEGSAAGGDASGGFWGTVGGLLTSTAAKAGGGILAGLGVLFENAIKHQGNDDIFTAEEEAQYEKENWMTVYGQRIKFQINKLKELEQEIEDIEEEEELLDDTGLLLSPRDRQAVEDYWDALTGGQGVQFIEDAYKQMYEQFSGSSEDLAVLDKIMAMIDGIRDFGYAGEDLPAWWFSDLPQNGGDGGLTSEDISGFKGLPGQISAAARAGTAQGISGIKVYMDGVAVGHLVAPTVSQDIAWNVG